MKSNNISNVNEKKNSDHGKAEEDKRDEMIIQRSKETQRGQ